MNYFAENGASFVTCSFFAQRQNYSHDYKVSNATDCGNILNSLKKIKETGNKSKFIGFVDDDKKVNPYSANFKISMPFKAGVAVKAFENQFLIVINPAIDLFLFDNAQEIKLDLSKYKFNPNFKLFKNQLKSEQIHSNPLFRNLLNELYQNKKCSCFVALQEAFNHIYNQKIG